jgi:hypothetical protein
LREQCGAQIVQQTKPSPRQSKNLADKVIQVIQDILELKETMNETKAELYQFETMIQTSKYDDGWEISDVRLHLTELKGSYKKVDKSMKTKSTTMGADGWLNLEHLLGNKFLCLCASALALKQ